MTFSPGGGQGEMVPELVLADAAERDDLGAFAARAVRLDGQTVVRLRNRNEELLDAWVATPFDALATRTVAGQANPANDAGAYRATPAFDRAVLDIGEGLRTEMRLGEGPATDLLVLGPSATADGQVLIGQTSDTPAEIEQYAYGLRLKPAGRPAILLWTFGGMLGYHGLNAHGVAHFANALGGGPPWKFALSHYPLKRLILEQRSLPDVLELMRRVRVC